MSWPTVPIEAIVSVKGGKRLPKGHDFSLVPTDHPYIRARDIGNNRITFTDRVYVTDHTFNKIKNYTVSVNDLVVTIVGASIGDVGFITDEFDGANLTENAARLRVNEAFCDPKFLSLQLSTPRMKEKFQLLTGGSAQGKLGLYKINAFKVLLPPLPIQRKIATILSAYDDLIESNRRRIQLLEQAARLLYKEWFVHLRFPGHEHVKIKDGVPEGWEKGVVSDFYTTASGGTPSRKVPDFYAGDIPWVKTQELIGGFILSTEERITEEAIKSSSAKPFPRHTVLVAMYGATIGQTAILSVTAATNQACCAVIPSAPGTNYAYAYLFFNHYKTDLVGLGQGAAQKNISQQVIKAFKMVLPTKGLLDAFSESVSPLFDQIETLQRTNINLTKARDLLLPRLMNGDLVI